MELRQLKYLIAIIDYGSISKASGQLRIAQPALSHQISNLEIELGTKLLIRSARGAVPTEAGMRLYRQAQVILAHVEEAKMDARMSDFTDPFSGSVSIGLPTSTSTILALPLLHEIHERFPRIQLRLVEGLSGLLLEMMLRHRLDLAIQFRSEPVVGLQVEHLLDEKLFLVSSRPEADGEPIDLAELGDRMVSLPGLPHSMRLVVDDYCRARRIELRIVFEVDSLPALRAIAATGLASVILPQSALAEPSAYGPLYSRPIKGPSLSRPLGLCRSDATLPSRAVEAVEEVLRFLVRELVTSGVWTGVTLSPGLLARTPDKSILHPDKRAEPGRR